MYQTEPEFLTAKVLEAAAALETVKLYAEAQQTVKHMNAEQRREAAFFGLSGGASKRGLVISAVILETDPRVHDLVRDAYALQHAKVDNVTRKRDQYFNDEMQADFDIAKAQSASFDRLFAKAETGAVAAPNVAQTQRDAFGPPVKNSLEQVVARVPPPKPAKFSAPPIVSSSAVSHVGRSIHDLQPTGVPLLNLGTPAPKPASVSNLKSPALGLHGPKTGVPKPPPARPPRDVAVPSQTVASEHSVGPFASNAPATPHSAPKIGDGSPTGKHIVPPPSALATRPPASAVLAQNKSIGVGSPSVVSELQKRFESKSLNK